MKDYYKILELEFGATQKHINEQHRFMLHAWHPDKFPTIEQKIKAEERVKEIIEAYSILGDPVKRAKYDREFRTNISSARRSPSPKPTDTKFPQSRPSNDSRQHCESCGLPTDTKYVEFYENIGALITRYHRSIKGNICKSCIDYYFWNLTGKTMVLGWWGVISFIVTPFILLNNLIRYIFTIGMKKHPMRIAPSPSPFWVFSTIVGFLLIGFFFCSFFSSLLSQPTNSPSSSESSSVAPIKALTPKPIPTRTPVVIKTPTGSLSNCIHWSKVNSNLVGRRICVFGTVYDISSTNQVATRIEFSSEPNTFFIYDANYFYPDLEEGDCVYAEELLQLFDNRIPFIAVSELYICESWMK